MAKDSEIRKAADMIQKAIPNKNRYDRPIWQGILDLIEQCNYGKNDAKSDIVSPLPPGKNQIEEMFDGSFDGVQMYVLDICNSILGEHGSVSMFPYSSGIGTRSMSLEFKAKRG